MPPNLFLKKTVGNAWIFSYELFYTHFNKFNAQKKHKFQLNTKSVTCFNQCRNGIKMADELFRVRIQIIKFGVNDVNNQISKFQVYKQSQVVILNLSRKANVWKSSSKLQTLQRNFN